MGVTRVARTSYLSEARELTPVLMGSVLIAQSLVFCIVFCISLFVLLSFS